MARQPFQWTGLPGVDNLQTFASAVGRYFQKLDQAVPPDVSVQTLTSNTTLPDGLRTESVLYRCDASTAAFTVTLPASITSEGTHFWVKKIDSSGHAVTWLCQGSDTVEGTATATLAAQWNYKRFYCRAGGYDILGG